MSGPPTFVAAPVITQGRLASAARGIGRSLLPRRRSCAMVAGRPHAAVAAAAAAAAASATAKSLRDLRYENTFTSELPGDHRQENYTRQIEGAVFARIKPTDPHEGLGPDAPLRPPKIAAWSQDCAQVLGLSPDAAQDQQTLDILAGAALLDEYDPYAQVYGGHQFGSWAGQLGDGRAISLAEAINKNGDRWELQLKGAGRTPCSRFADGRAVMRSSVREFLCSEAMHHLGIPTTRALALIDTGAPVLRDQFYNGNAKMEPGAVVCRLAPSFIRLGTFELPASRGDIDLLTQVADYTIKYHYPELLEKSSDPKDPQNRYVCLLEQVIRKTAFMISHWQSVGFVHGVCNTDNFSILGLTIDYGPYGFLDKYDPKYTPNTTDLPGRRYCYERQPNVGLWNLLQFAQALVPLMTVDSAKGALAKYEEVYTTEFTKRMSSKMGIATWNGADDAEMLSTILQNMEEDAVDFTNFWRNLAAIKSEIKDVSDDTAVLKCLGGSLQGLASDERKSVWADLLRRYAARVEQEKLSDADRAKAMNEVNPKVILRNYIAQTAIEQAEVGEYAEIARLLEVLRTPFDDACPEEYTQEPPQWATRPGVCVNSCSS